MDDQQKGTDLPEKHKTSLPFSPSPFLKPVNAVWIFHFQDGGDVTIPLVSCLGSAKAIQCPLSEPKIREKSQQIPRYSPVCLRGQPPRMAADKCITEIGQNFHDNKIKACVYIFNESKLQVESRKQF